MKKYIITSSILILFLTSCTDRFDENVLQKNGVIAGGNKIIKIDSLYGDKGGIKQFYSAFLSNEKSIYYCGGNWISSDRHQGQNKEFDFKGYRVIGKINESGDIAWEQALTDIEGIGGMVQNSQNDVYVCGNKYENNELRKFIANVSRDGTIKELNTGSLPALYTIRSMKHINDNLFIAAGSDNDENSYLMILRISAMNVEVVKTVFYENGKYWDISYVEQINMETYDIVLACENERSQLFARKIRLRLNTTNISTLWEKTITSDMMQNPHSTLTSSVRRGNHAVKIDNEICIAGYGENDIAHATGDGYKWKRGLVANLNYNTGEPNWLQTIPYKNTTVGDVKINSILYSEGNFYVVGQYNSTLNNTQLLSYGFAQKISRNGDVSNIQIFGGETEYAYLEDGIILNKKLFLFGYKGRIFRMDFPYSNLTVNSTACQAWFMSCNINDF